jgi:hypothetical protein
MIDTDKYEGHTEGPWEFKHINSNWYQCDKIGEMHMEDIAIEEASVNAQLIADAPLLLEEVKRLRKALHIEEQIVQAFYEYREDCCFDHCEAWMLENGHRVVVKIDGDEQSEWKVEVE